MNILEVDLQHPDLGILAQAIEHLKNGGVVLHPTETCYGFTVDISQRKALNLLYAIKGMALDKPTSMMVKNFDEAALYASFEDTASQLAKKYWPGPLTLVLPRKEKLPHFFNEGHSTVGIRCPDSSLTQSLLEGVGRPLATTSANVSGQPETYRVEDFLQQWKSANLEPGFENEILILNAGELPKNPPSTLVGFEKGKIKILREGSLAEEIRGAFL